ncbi:hypothetical protein JXA02_10020 [candidate division KSB1 bacterium]|nr:hypothetical protein [candidate division KSB1 bacterium]RQW03804.1 MAG: hypothetical protein EH222_11985 [candidate division KSB1 bacterium]
MNTCNRLIVAGILLLFCPRISESCLAQDQQIFFQESTFTKFAYPHGELDEEFTQKLEKESAAQFPKAGLRMVRSYITIDKPRKVVSYYSGLCGKRFQKRGDRFTYIFSEMDDVPASRIEIYPVVMGRIHHEFWPSRIDIYLIRFPISIDATLPTGRSAESLALRIGPFYYPGVLREDVALIDMEQFGAESEVFVIETADDFDVIYEFFRRQYGGIAVRPARDGDMLTRNFEIDISRALGEADRDKLLYLYVEENPLVSDRTGNSQVYRGKVFVRYVFWKKSKEDYSD